MRQAFNWQSQQRVDVPHLLMLENSIIFDGNTLMQMQQGLTAQILSGFNIATPWSFSQPANSLQVIVSGASVCLTQDPNGSFLVIPAGTPNSQLNSANTQVTGSFTPSSINYVAVQFTRLPDPATADLVAFWDEDASTEFDETVPLGLVLNYQFVINTSGFGVNAPICQVRTDAFNNIIDITNCKQNLYRLGSGGATPNANNEFILSLNPENPLTSTSSATDPFIGGDWQLANMKNWMDEVMTQIKQIKGTAYWYSPGSSVVTDINLVDVFFDTDASVLTSGGSFIHSLSTAGQLSWSENFYIKSIIGNLYYTVPINTIQLDPGQVGYIALTRNVLAQSGAQFTFTNGSTLVTCSIPITDANLTSSSNTWIKTIGGDMSMWVQISGTVTPSSLTFNLTSAYAFPTVIDKAVIALASYNVTVADPVNVPASGDSFWIAKRDDNWPSPTSVPPGPGSWPLALSGTIMRVTNEVTADTASAHGLAVGQTIVIAGVTSDPTLNGTFQVTSVPTLTSFEYDSVGTDSSGTAIPGTVTPGAVIYLRNNKTLPQGESIAIDNIDTNNIITYIGSKGESDTSPSYSDAFPSLPTPNNVVTDGNNLTQAIKQLDIQDGVVVVGQNQDRNLKLVEGGTWAFNGVTQTLSWSSEAYIQIPGLALTSNSINPSSAVFVNDGDVAYVELNRLTNSPTTLTVNVGPSASLSMDANTLIIARYFAGPPNYVIFGNSSTAMYDGQAAVIDGGVALVSDFFNELRMFAANPNTSRVILENSDITMPTGEERSQRISSFLLNFDGAQIDFQTGDIYEADGVTALGVNFTPVIPATGMWRWFSVTVIPSSVGSDNRMSGQILILPGSADGASASAAPRAIFAGGSGIGIGQVVITSADGINVTAITQADLVQLSAGSGSGSGSGINKVDVFDPVSTTLSTTTPTVIDGVTVISGLTGLFSNLLTGNNEVYQAEVTGGGSSPSLPNPIVLQISSANPYLGGNMESVTGGVATPQASNDAYFEINGTTGGAGTPAIAGSFDFDGMTYYTATTGQVAQGFTSATTGACGTATMVLAQDGSATITGNIILGIQSDNAGDPSGTYVSNTISISATSLALATTSLFEVSPVSFGFNSGSLVLGTVYHLVADFSGVTFNSGNIYVGLSTTTTITPAQKDVGLGWQNLQIGANNTNLIFAVTTGSGLISSNSSGAGNNNLPNAAYEVSATTTVVAQPFTPASSITATAILYEIGSFNSYTGTYSVSIYTDNAGQPGSSIGTVNINGSTINSVQAQQWTIASLSASLASGTQYWIVWNFANIIGFGGIAHLNLGWGGCPATQPPEMSYSTDGGVSYTVYSAATTIFAILSGGSSPVIIAENLSVNTTENITTNLTNLGQTFTAGFTAFLNDAIFQLSIPSASPANSGNLYVDIYTDNAGQPGTLIEQSSAINSASLTTTPTNYTFTFSGSNSLTNTTLYHAILNASGLTGTMSSGTISWTPQPIFATPYTPTAGDEVIITEGTEFHDQVAEFNGVAGTWLINNTVRYFNGTDYWEQSSIITSTLVNNTTGNVFSVTALGSENIQVDYSCLRNGVKEMGTVWLTNDGTNASVAGGDSYTGSVGLTFTASLTAGNVNLIYTLDNSGGSGTMKYSIKRWSDGPGGPTGVPNYSPYVPSNVINSAFTMSDGSSTPYNCLSPFNVTGLTNITLDFSYTVGLNAGTTVGALNVYVNGQRISRYVSNAITPPGPGAAGTLYTEISATQIQFTTNIMSPPLPVEIILE